MLTHDQLMEKWAKDSIIDQTDLMHVLYSHPMKHSAYLSHLMEYKVQLRKHVLKYANLKAIKIRYFSGECTKEELDKRGWQQYLFRKPIKSEMEALLEADSDLQLIQEQSVYLESLVQACESILKDLGNRYYLYKSIIEFTKFQAGV